MQQNRVPASKKSVWWWAYFVLSLGVYVASIFVEWHRVQGHIAVTFHWVQGDEDLALFYGFGFVGLVGYLRSVAIWRRWFWVGYACVTYAGAAVGLGITVLQALHSDAAFLMSLLAIGVVVAFPLWVALWRYAFHSDGIWHNVSAAA